MEPSKFIELQKQMRENNEEVSDFLKDFGEWKRIVDVKSSKLECKPSVDDELPAVRNSLLKKKRKKSKPKEMKSVSSEQRIKSHDYHSWDKFDIDKALEEVDTIVEKPPVTSDSSEETDEEMENLRRINLSKESRELGNVRFKERNFYEAVEHYTTAIRLTPEDPIPLINRAFAYLKLERYASAEADCSAALKLDGKCVKALYRRAVARKHLDKHKDAIQDLQTILAMDRSNTAALSELSLLTNKSTSELKEQISPTQKQKNIPRTFRRIPIIEVGAGGDPSPQPHVSHSVTSETVNTRSQTFSSTASPSADQLSVTMSGGDTPSNLRITLNPNGPSNWFQLERELRELNTGSQTPNKAAIDYLCRLTPNNYECVIGNNLETGFISQILYAFLHTSCLAATDIISRLNYLAKLPRFDVAWLLASPEDHTLLDQLLDRLRSDNTSVEQLEFVKTHYL